MIYTPTKTAIPRSNSYPIIRRLKIMGSTKDAKNAPVENMAKAIEILAAFIEAKKVIQCKAMIIPAIIN